MRKWRQTWLQAVMACVAVLFATDARSSGQDVIYAATGGGAPGSLYTLNSGTGAATLVGALTDAGANAYSLTGLAFQPGSGTLFGVTANASPTGGGFGALLVMVNPATGAVTQVGGLGVSTMSDITFAPNGTLYGWHAAGDHSLYTINPVTGAATLVAATSPNPGFGGGSLASTATGVLFSTPDSATNPPGTLNTVSTVTGQLSFVATLSGAPLVTGGGSMIINSSDFSSSGVMFGINSDQAALTNLVTINTATGAISDVGSTGIAALDGLAIFHGAAVPEPTTWALMGLSGLVLSGGVYYRRWAQKRRVRGYQPV